MKYIGEKKITGLLDRPEFNGRWDFEKILDKARRLQRLTLEESACLLAVNEPGKIAQIFAAASEVKDKIYGRRVVLFAPLYISNYCSNSCVYCAFRKENELLSRRWLTIEEIENEVRWLLNRGHKRILLVAAESAPPGKRPVDYYVEAIEAIYNVRVGPHKIRRVNINCAPLLVEEFKKLKKAGIGTYQLFQETYHEPTYRLVHPAGPKSDPDDRIAAIDRAFEAGIDDLGIGVLYGLYDYRFETLALLEHIEALEDKFGLGPHTISVPRLEPALGSEFSKNSPYKVSDEDFKKVVAILRLSVPYTGMILTTRETPAMRDELFNLGISQISAESRTAPGGYTVDQEAQSSQFALSDGRSLDEIISTLIEKKNIPSFCAACYRRARTGEVFMNLAKPGTIKGKCNLNALITLKEYLDDFASGGVKEAGYSLIEEVKENLDEENRIILEKYFKDIDRGLRDEYV
jgi:2-iminoacetate synthase